MRNSAFRIVALAVFFVIVCGVNAQRRPLSRIDQVSAPTVTGTMYGVNRVTSSQFNAGVRPVIYQIDRLTGQTSNPHQLSLLGFTIFTAQTLATRPADNVLFAVLQTTQGDPLSRRLVSVNPTTGVCTDIGPLTNESISSIVFRPSNGVLYAVSGTLGTDPEWLFTVDQTTAVLTKVFQMSTGFTSGDVIAFAPDGFLYYSTGDAPVTLERVDVDTHAISVLGSNAAYRETFALGYSTNPAAMYASDFSNNLYTVDLTNGVRTLVAALGPDPTTANANRGLAIVIGPTAATVAVSGRVLTPGASGVRGALVTMQDSTGTSRKAMTNAFGYYSFDNVEQGSYIVSVSARGLKYAPRVLSVNDQLAGIDFTPMQ